VAGATNTPIVRLLLERGAVPDDHDLYLAGFGGDSHECLRLLLDHTTDVAGVARMALAAPISTNYLEGVRLLLAAGADPRRYVGDDAPPSPVVYAAVRSACGPELVDLLLAHGADPDAPGPDGRSPYALATGKGRTEIAALLRRRGATDDTTDVDRFLSACLRADDADVRRQLTHDPGLPGRLTGSQQAAAIVQAAEAGNTAAVGLMLDLSFPIDAHAGDDGAHGAARRRLLRQRQHRQAPDRPRRRHRGTRHPLGRPPAGLGHGRQQGTARDQPAPRLGRHHPGTDRGRRLHRGHHAVPRRPQAAQPRHRRTPARIRHRR
jgi:hypothetical protein